MIFRKDLRSPSLWSGQCSSWRLGTFDRNEQTEAIQSQMIVEADACNNEQMIWISKCAKFQNNWISQYVNRNCSSKTPTLGMEWKEVANNQQEWDQTQPKILCALQPSLKAEAMESSTVTIQCVTKLGFTLHSFLAGRFHKIFKTKYWKIKSSDSRILTFDCCIASLFPPPSSHELIVSVDSSKETIATIKMTLMDQCCHGDWQERELINAPGQQDTLLTVILSMQKERYTHRKGWPRPPRPAAFR